MIICADQKNSTSPHYGIIEYIHTKLQINKVEYMSTETKDTLYTNITLHKKKNQFFQYTIAQKIIITISKNI